LVAIDPDVKARRRLAGRIGVPNALEELREVLAILKIGDALDQLGTRLAPHIRNLADEQLENVNALLDASVAGRNDLGLYPLLLVMSRLGSRWHLIRLAVRSAETDVAARIAQTPAAH